jgi:hypothetical protein
MHYLLQHLKSQTFADSIYAFSLFVSMNSLFSIENFNSVENVTEKENTRILCELRLGLSDLIKMKNK